MPFGQQLADRAPSGLALLPCHLLGGKGLNRLVLLGRQSDRSHHKILHDDPAPNESYSDESPRGRTRLERLRSYSPADSAEDCQHNGRYNLLADKWPRVVFGAGDHLRVVAPRPNRPIIGGPSTGHRTGRGGHRPGPESGAGPRGRPSSRRPGLPAWLGGPPPRAPSGTGSSRLSDSGEASEWDVHSAGSTSGSLLARGLALQRPGDGLAGLWMAVT